MTKPSLPSAAADKTGDPGFCHTTVVFDDPTLGQPILDRVPVMPQAVAPVPYEERIARYLELPEAAQDAACRTSDPVMQVTYARLASQWP